MFDFLHARFVRIERFYTKKMNEMVNEGVTTAKAISELGMMAVTAGFFLVLSASLMIACFLWFKSIINRIINGNAEKTEELLEETRKQNAMLQDISEGLMPETQLRIKNLGSIFFDYSVEKTCRIIKTVREENHIANKEATKKKIRTLLVNIHEDRNSRFDSYVYRGKRLSTYTKDEWIDWVAEVVENEVYAEKPNNGRAYTNVQAVFDKIKLDFYHQLNY